MVSSPGGSSSSGGVGVGGGNRRDDDVVAIASGFQPEGIYSREVFVLGSEHLDKWILSKTNREKVGGGAREKGLSELDFK